jgi:hypothetical protein
MMFFKGAPSKDNFRGIHNFFEIPIVKVLFSNLLSKKGMSYVTYPMRERVKRNLPYPDVLIIQTLNAANSNDLANTGRAG